MRKAAKVDANQDQIVLALRTMGATVQSLAAVGRGVPDLLVGYKGKTILMEVKDGRKTPSQRRLTEDQLKWHGTWNGGTLAVVDGVEAALRVLGTVNDF
jgi:Holliday junction resolvase